MYGQMDKAPYARRQQTCAHLSVCSSGLSFVTQKAAEMKGRKGRIVSLRNIHVRTPEVLLVLSLYIYIYMPPFIIQSIHYKTICTTYVFETKILH